jgi:DNA-binding MarR family transcriptional regulator
MPAASQHKPSIPMDHRDALKAILAALEPFHQLRDTMPLQHVRSFLIVATEEHLNVSTYAIRAGTSQSLMTRYIADLGTVNRYHEDGFGLVEAYVDLMDRRNQRIRLTPKGKNLAWKMFQAIAA